MYCYSSLRYLKHQWLGYEAGNKVKRKMFEKAHAYNVLFCSILHKDENLK